MFELAHSITGLAQYSPFSPALFTLLCSQRTPQIMVKNALPPLVMALDVGTSSVRAIVFDRQGQRFPGAQAVATHAPRTTSDGRAEFEAEAVLQRAVQVLHEALLRCGAAGRDIVAVGISMFWHSLVGVDAQGRAVTPVYMWSDLRSAPQARTLQNRLHAPQVHARTGCVLHPMYLPAKLLWLQQTQPHLFRACRTWMSLAEYFILRLFGHPFCSLSMASGSGLLNLRHCTWDTALLTELGLTPQQLGTLIDRDQPLHGLRPEFHQQLGLLTKCPWFAPVGDGACSNVGSGSATDTTMALTIGTSAALRVVTRTLPDHLPHGLWEYRLDRQRLVLGGALNNAGNLFAWLRERLQLGNNTTIERQLASLPPDAHGLTVLPFLAGERNPYWSLSTPAAIVGLRSHTQAVEILQACLEAIAYRLRLIHMRLQHVRPVQRLLVNGGVLASPAWLQILADVLGQPLTAVAEPEAASRGAALLALEALGVWDDVAQVPTKTAVTYAPIAAHVERYQQGLQRHEQLYQRLTGFLDENTLPSHG
jgi:gluconokinase